MTLLDRNGKNLPPRKPAAQAEPAQKKPEDFIYMANAKAVSRTNVVAVIGERLFQAWWQRRLSRWWRGRPKVQEIDAAMVESIRAADLWQEHINRYQNNYAERIHNREVERAGASGLVLPSWGEIKDHFPGGQAMFPEAF